MKKLLSSALILLLSATMAFAAPPFNNGGNFNGGGSTRGNVVVSGPYTPTISTATFAINAANSNTFRVVLVHAACPCTISNPTNPVDGQKITIEMVQSSTGSDTIGTWGTAYDFGTAGAPTLTTTASKIDYLGFQYSAQNSKWNYLGDSLGM